VRPGTTITWTGTYSELGKETWAGREAANGTQTSSGNLATPRLAGLYLRSVSPQEQLLGFLHLRWNKNCRSVSPPTRSSGFCRMVMKLPLFQPASFQSEKQHLNWLPRSRGVRTFHADVVLARQIPPRSKTSLQAAERSGSGSSCKRTDSW